MSSLGDKDMVLPYVDSKAKTVFVLARGQRSEARNQQKQLLIITNFIANERKAIFAVMSME